MHPFLKFWYDKKGSKEHSYSYKGIEITVFPKVFSPFLTISTKILLDLINEKDIKNKHFLELGAGSGIVSFFASTKGAIVTASEISKPALDGLYYNKEKLKSDVTIIASDLFTNIQNTFDIIIINPPYYPRKPKTEEEMAWFCGEDFEYFSKLFHSLTKVTHSQSDVYMILSQDCNIDHIKSIAAENNFSLNLVYQKTKWLEKNYIFKIKNI